MIEEFEKKTGKKFDEYYIEYKNKLKYHLLKNSHGFEQEIEDQVQESFIHLCKQIKYFEPTKSTLNTFFTSISVNRLRQLHTHRTGKLQWKKINTDDFTPRHWDLISRDLNDDSEEYIEEYNNRIKVVEKFLKQYPGEYGREIFNCRMAFMNCTQTSKHLNIGLNKVAYFWNRFNKFIGYKKYDKYIYNGKLENEIVEMRNDLYSFNQIGKKMGLDPHMVRRIYKKQTGWITNYDTQYINPIYRFENNKWILDHLVQTKVTKNESRTFNRKSDVLLLKK